MEKNLYIYLLRTKLIYMDNMVPSSSFTWNPTCVVWLLVSLEHTELTLVIKHCGGGQK